jgi:serine/threonine-protein kinase HipA
MSRKGLIYRDENLAGILEELEDGRCVFAYLPEYLALPDAISISLALPLSSEPTVTRGLHPFFDGLVPEGWLLDLATRNWKIDPRDRMSLLLATCSDCIGAVRVLEMGES